MMLSSALVSPGLASPALEQALRSGDLSAAREALRASPGTSEQERSWNRARVDLLAGATRRAVATLERLVEADPESSDYRLWYSRALLAEASEASILRRALIARRAVAALEEAFEADPRNDDAAIDLILVHLRVPLLGGGTRAAGAVLETLERRRSKVASFARGIIAYEAQRWDDAERELVDAAESLDDPRRALFWLGYLHQRLQRWDEAFHTHQTLLELSPNDPRVWYEIARTAEFSGLRVDEGKAMLRRYLEAELPSGSRTREQARELLRKLDGKE